MSTTPTPTVPTPNDLYHTAQILARQGQPVFPCAVSIARHNRPAKQPLVRHGYMSASTDPAQIKSWWSKFRGAAIGTPTGTIWDVLDVDPNKDGDAEKVDGRTHIAYLQRVGLLNGCQRVVLTPSGGYHLYFKAAPVLKQGIGADKYMGLDIRAMGGYVVAPGSYVDVVEKGYAGLYKDGGTMEGSTNDPLVWDQIRAAIRPVNTATNKPIEVLSAKRSANLGAIRHWLSGQTQQGDRNHSLFWATMRCIDNGIDPHELIEVAIFIGLDEAEVTTTIEQAMRRAGVGVNDLMSEGEVLFPAAI